MFRCMRARLNNGPSVVTFVPAGAVTFTPNSPLVSTVPMPPLNAAFRFSRAIGLLLAASALRQSAYLERSPGSAEPGEKNVSPVYADWGTNVPLARSRDANPPEELSVA